VHASAPAEESAVRRLRQFLRRSERECHAEMWSVEQPDRTLIIYTMCSHLKRPRQLRVYGSQRYRGAVWEQVRGELSTHTRYSDPW
jgi:hypothetical protein